MAAIDFTILSNWTQSPVGTITWSSGATNYARTDTKLTSGVDWEFTCDPSASNLGTGTTCGMGISLSATPDHLFKWNYCWFLQNPSGVVQIGYWFTAPDGTSQNFVLSTYTPGAIYSIKCVSNAVSFYKDGVLVVATTAGYNFDSSVNTLAYFSSGQAADPNVIVTCTDGASIATGAILPPPPAYVRL